MARVLKYDYFINNVARVLEELKNTLRYENSL